MKIQYRDSDGGEVIFETEKNTEEIELLIEILNFADDFNIFDGKTGHRGKFEYSRYEILYNNETTNMEEFLILYFDFNIEEVN